MRPGCKTGLIACLFAVGIVAGAGDLFTASGAPAYPLEKSANRRYLVDQNGAPVLITGDAPQALIVNVSEADAEMYFENRRARGFNTLWVNLLCTTYTGGRPDGSTIDGVMPFNEILPSSSSYDLETPNEAYFAHVDRIVAMAAEQGIQILLDPIETAGWMPTLLDNGATKCRNYGRYLGTRYAGFDNIIWMSGNDFQDWRNPASDAVALAVALGIRDNDARHLHTIELDYLVSSSLDDPNWVPILGVNETYTYYPTYARLRQDYNRPNFLPIVMIEANYEFESILGPTTTAPILRKQEYWTMTSGAAGHVYGNGYIWPFLGGWQANLDTPGALQIRHLKALFEPRAWYALVPDTAHVVVTAGYGTYASTGAVASNNFTTAARTADGSLVVVYTPVIRAFTVDMSKLSAAATARWFDPSTGAYASIAGSPLPNSGPRSFTPPGNNGDGDGGWTLVLETNPPETVPPVVSLAAPEPGAVLAGTVQLAATASDNVGVVSVQFAVDGKDVGLDVSSPPYVTAWNSLTVSNGPHVVRATARDLAGNSAADSIAVTVTNVIPPPPTDHLAAAYALDGPTGTTAVDASGNGNTLVLHNAAYSAGRNGFALGFDGAGDYAEAPNSASLNFGGTGLTIACWVWVNPVVGATDYVVVGKAWDAGAMASPFYQYGLEYSNNTNKTLDLIFGDPSGVMHGPYRMSPAVRTWTHVAYTYDGSVVRGYLDGVERLTVSDVSSLQARGYSLKLGVDGVYQQFMNGAVDDLRIYSRALTTSEILSAMQTPVGGTVDAGGRLPPALAIEARNPFVPGSRIYLTLPAAGSAELRVFDVSGRLVRTILSGALNAGRQSFEWDGLDARGRPAPSGRYFIRFRAGGAEATSAVILVR